jgi:hypothetical protein
LLLFELVEVIAIAAITIVVSIVGREYRKEAM